MGFIPLNPMINAETNNAQIHLYATIMYSAQDIAALINPLSMGIDKILLEMQRGPGKINTTITNLQQAVHKKTRELLE